MPGKQFILGFFAAIAFGVPLSIWAIFFAAENVTNLLHALLAAIAVVVGLLSIFVLFRQRIFAALRLKVDILL